MYLLDTSILSALLRKRPQDEFLARLRQHANEVICTSCVCVMELRRGAMRRDDATAFWSRIERDILSAVDHVLVFGNQEAMIAGDVMALLWRRGQIIDVEDVMIGATALARQLTVVTSNLDHFRRIPRLPVEDWTSSPS